MCGAGSPETDSPYIRMLLDVLLMVVSGCTAPFYRPLLPCRLQRRPVAGM